MSEISVLMKKEADAGMLKRILRMGVTRRVPVIAGHCAIAPSPRAVQGGKVCSKHCRIWIARRGTGSRVCRTMGNCGAACPSSQPGRQPGWPVAPRPLRGRAASPLGSVIGRRDAQHEPQGLELGRAWETWNKKGLAGGCGDLYG